MKKLVVLFAVIALAVGAFFYFGGADRVNEARVQSALIDAGVPEGLATCMAPRMVDRLTLGQLRKLERLGPTDGESAMPLSAGEAMARIRRVDDPEALEVTLRAAAGCTLQRIVDGP